jgi:hypothetical protein
LLYRVGYGQYFLLAEFPDEPFYRLLLSGKFKVHALSPNSIEEDSSADAIASNELTTL